MTIESYDGLCGIIATFATSDLQLRCNHSLGHHGLCSFEKYRDQFILRSHCGPDPKWAREKGFINSVLANMKK